MRDRNPAVAFSDNGLGSKRRNSASGLRLYRLGHSDIVAVYRPSPTFHAFVGQDRPGTTRRTSRTSNRPGRARRSPTHLATGTLTAFPTSFHRKLRRLTVSAGKVQLIANPCRRSASRMSGVTNPTVGQPNGRGGGNADRRAALQCRIRRRQPNPVPEYPRSSRTHKRVSGGLRHPPEAPPRPQKEPCGDRRAGLQRSRRVDDAAESQTQRASTTRYAHRYPRCSSAATITSRARPFDSCSMNGTFSKKTQGTRCFSRSRNTSPIRPDRAPAMPAVLPA